MINRWYHRRVLKHEQDIRHITIGLFDPSRGLLIKCSCKKVWAI